MKNVSLGTQKFSALVWKEDKWYVARALEVEVASQGKSRQEAINNLKEALELYFEDEPKLTSTVYQDLTIERIDFSYA